MEASVSVLLDTADRLEHFKPNSDGDTCKERLLMSRPWLHQQIMSLWNAPMAVQSSWDDSPNQAFNSTSVWWSDASLIT